MKLGSPPDRRRKQKAETKAARAKARRTTEPKGKSKGVARSENDEETERKTNEREAKWISIWRIRQEDCKDSEMHSLDSVQPALRKAKDASKQMFKVVAQTNDEGEMAEWENRLTVVRQILHDEQPEAKERGEIKVLVGRLQGGGQPTRK